MKSEGLNIISLGLGVQSTAMYYMSSMGQLPRADYAIFVDTGREKKKTLAYLEYLLQWQQENNGIPIIVVRKKNLFNDLLNYTNSTGQRFSSIPAFTPNENGSKGMLRRQCTNEYKIEQVNQQARELYGLAARKRMPRTIIRNGISSDEIERVSIPKEAWKVHFYPFCMYYVDKTRSTRHNHPVKTRTDIIAWYIAMDLPIPPKSACVFCPYQSDASYYGMKANEPEDFTAAASIDKAIRNSTKKGVNSPLLLHESCKPLDEIDFKPGDPDLWHGECLDNCHI